jgi:hypothetical protein
MPSSTKQMIGDYRVVETIGRGVSGKFPSLYLFRFPSLYLSLTPYAHMHLSYMKT